MEELDPHQLSQENGSDPQQIDWNPFYLDFDGLNRRLQKVKREFGMRKAISTQSLTGETRTLAEILDKEIEKVVLFFLRIQGDLAYRAWKLREQQNKLLNGETLITTEQLTTCRKMLTNLSYDLLELLEYLESNVNGLRRIIKRYDSHFDIKMGRFYFDSRLGSEGKHSQLLQLYHQEGLHAIIGALRNGFSDLNNAQLDLQLLKVWGDEVRRNIDEEASKGSYGSLLEPTVGAFPSMQDLKGNSREVNQQYIDAEAKSLLESSIRRDASSIGLHLSLRSGSERVLPVQAKSSYLSRLAAHFSVSQLVGLEVGDELALQCKLPAYASEAHSLLGNAPPQSNTNSPANLIPLYRTLSDIEPVLKRIDDVQDRVIRSQARTFSDYLVSHSEMALESRRTEQEDSDDEALPSTAHAADSAGKGGGTNKRDLFLTLLVTFLFMSNQYIVGPTSGQYSAILGESKSNGALIVGLSPIAALLSTVLYSYWTNFAFKPPLLLAAALATSGNLLYGMALQYDSSSMLFWGRFLCGLGAPRVIARRYIADHVSPKHVTLASTHFVTAGALGLAFGPLVSSLIDPLVDLQVRWSGATVVRFTSATAPGWIMFVLWLPAFLGVLFLFEEPAHDKYPKSEPSPSLLEACLEGLKSLCTCLCCWNERCGRSASYADIPGEDLAEGLQCVELGEVPMPNDEDASTNGGHRGRRRSISSDSSLIYGAPTFDHGHDKPLHQKRDSGQHQLGRAVTLTQRNNSLNVLTRMRELSMKPDLLTEPIVNRPLLVACCDCGWLWQHVNFEVTVVLLLYAVNKIGQEAVVCSIPDLTNRLFQWEANKSGAFMAAMGALVLPANILLSYFKDAEDRQAMLTLFVLEMVAFFIVVNFGLVEYSAFQYMSGCILLFSALNAQEGIMMSLLARVTSAESSRNMFLNAGFLATEVGTLGRVVADLGITATMSVYSTGIGLSSLENKVFLFLAGLTVLAMCMFHLSYDAFKEKKIL